MDKKINQLIEIAEFAMEANDYAHAEKKYINALYLMDNPKPIIPVDTKFSTLECGKAFDTLTEQEKLYAYYFSRASWEGAKICYF